MKNNHILDEEHILLHVYYIMVTGITFNRFAHILSNDGMHFPVSKTSLASLWLCICPLLSHVSDFTSNNAEQKSYSTTAFLILYLGLGQLSVETLRSCGCVM